MPAAVVIEGIVHPLQNNLCIATLNANGGKSKKAGLGHRIRVRVPQQWIGSLHGYGLQELEGRFAVASISLNNKSKETLALRAPSAYFLASDAALFSAADQEPR